MPTGGRTGATSTLPRVSIDGERVQVETGGGARYVPLKSLGVGGMGEVTLVDDRDIGRKVARKRLLPGSGAPDVIRFVDEVRIIGQLDHPGIVPIHDVGLDEDGEFFYVMKYVDGETLEAIIERIAARDPATVAHWDSTRRIEVMIAVLHALEHAHAKGILHRDIKPANVMVGPCGEVLLLDWGVARPMKNFSEAREARSTGPVDNGNGNGNGTSTRMADTQSGALIGTPIFMSPEQASGATDTLDGRSDLYSVCLMFHEFLCGEHLHDDVADLNALILRVMTMVAPSSHALHKRYGIPLALGYFLEKGLQHAPADRWQSAREMLEELRAIRDGRCRAQCLVTFSERTLGDVSTQFRRRPIALLVGFGVAVCLFLGLAIFSAYHLFK